MPQNELPKPRNIIEAINFNIYNVSEDLHTLMDKVETMSKEIAELRAMFNAPEQPNALGETSAVGADPVSALQ